MNQTVIGVALIIAVASLLGLYSYLQNTRYELAETGTLGVYKVDRITGQTWFIRGDAEKAVKSVRR